MPPKRDVRYAANPMDYRKTIVPREIQKDSRCDSKGFFLRKKPLLSQRDIEGKVRVNLG